MLVKDLYVKLLPIDNVKIYSIKQDKDVWIGAASYIPSKYMFETLIAIYSTPFRTKESILTIAIR